MVALEPARVLDTRGGTGGPALALAAGETRSVVVGGRGGIPASGVAAAVVNITATDAADAGFVSAWPSGSSRPNASVLNVGAGETAPNLAILPLGADGAVELFSQSGTHLVMDVFGYLTDASVAPSLVGRFVPLPPARVFDTRPWNQVPAARSVDRPHAGLVGVPSGGVASVLLNVTGTGAVGPGFVTVWPAGSARPNVSSVNLGGAGDTRANAAVVPLGSGGRLSYFSSAGAHVVVDTSGYFTS